MAWSACRPTVYTKGGVNRPRSSPPFWRKRALYGALAIATPSVVARKVRSQRLWAAQLAAGAVGAAYVGPALKRLMLRFRTASRRLQVAPVDRSLVAAAAAPLVRSP